MKLTEDQIQIVRSEMVANGTPVRFQHEGQTLNIITGELQTKGINVINQIHYWKFSKETALKIADWLGVKAIFSE